MLDLKVTGLGQLERVAKLCNEAAGTGDKSVRREVTKAMKGATEPAKNAVREAARDMLPKRGGINEIVAGAVYTTRTSLKGNNPSVRMTGRWSGHDLRRIDRGWLRHPVFADQTKTRDEWSWVNQKVQPGFWTETLKREGLKTRRSVILAAKNVADTVTRG